MVKMGDHKVSSENALMDLPQSSTSRIESPFPSRLVVPIINRRASQNQSPRAHLIPAASAISHQSTCVAPSLISPADDLSPSPTDSVDTTRSPVYRLRTISSSDREESMSTPSSLNPSFDEDIDDNETKLTSNEDSCIRTQSGSRSQRLKRVRTEDVNAALIGALSSLSSMRKTKRLEPSQADELFAKSIVAELQRFPPRKRALIKMEIMTVISRHNDMEL